MKKVLVTGDSFYRIRQPYSNLFVDDILFDFNAEDKSLGDAWQYDAVVLHNPMARLLDEFIEAYTNDRNIVVVDIDDDFFSLPFSNPAFDGVKNKSFDVLKDCLKKCSYIHTSTPELKETVDKKKTEVFFNAVDFYDGGMRQEIRKNLNIPDGNKVIMWAGSPTHASDLVLIYPVIKELLKRNDITIVLCSDDRWLVHLGFRNEANMIIVPYMPQSIYLGFISIADVFLCPLVDNKFNRCKSELKVLESAVWKTPCVVSNVAPYQRFDDGSNVFIVKKERLPLWMSQIDAALSDDAVGKNAYDTVKKKYNLEEVNKKRAKWWKKILK